MELRMLAIVLNVIALALFVIAFVTKVTMLSTLGWGFLIATWIVWYGVHQNNKK